MLLEPDASGLEVVCAAFLSQEPVLIEELNNGIDIHTQNQKDLGLPTKLVAKIFQFRLIYGGSKWSYAMDPEFNHISDKPEYWEEVISNYYKKYKVLAKWHKDLMKHVEKNHRWTSPCGRVYEYSLITKKNGERAWPRTQILNYPVQGLGADLMTLARIALWNRIKNRPNTLFCNTVHDSIVLDVMEIDDALITNIKEAFHNIPLNFEKVYRSKFNVPMKCKIKVGPNWKDMKELGETNG